MPHLYSIISDNLHKRENDLSSLQNIVLSPKTDTPRERCIHRMTRRILERRLLPEQEVDDENHHHEQLILGFTELMCHPIPPHKRNPGLTFVLTFYSLTTFIFFRAMDWHPEYVKCCIMHLHYLRGQWPEVSIDLPFSLTEMLVYALSIQVQLELGDVDQDIEEMADLCYELLNSDIPVEALTNPIVAFCVAVVSRLKNTSQDYIPSEKVVGCLRKAVICIPDLPDGPLLLADCLRQRFRETLSDDDYKEGMTILDQINTSHDPGDGLGPESDLALTLAGGLAITRSSASGKPEHLEETIYRLRVLESKSHDPSVNQFLSFYKGSRFDNSSASVMANAQAAPRRVAESAKLPSFHDLIASLPELNPVALPSMAIHMKHSLALSPYTIERLTNIVDVEDGVKYCQQLLSSYPSSKLALEARLALGYLFSRAFELTHKFKYLDEAISAARDAVTVNTAKSQLGHDSSFTMLMWFLSLRLLLLNRREDLNEIMQLSPMVANNGQESFNSQFLALDIWVWIAHQFRHPSTSTAYDCAMSLMQASLTFSPTLDVQHARLSFATRIGGFKTLPLDYASYQICTGRLKQAIETLERGRVLLWSEMRGLRTSMDQIRLANSRLADELAAVNRDLEKITFAFPPNDSVRSGDDDIESMDPFGQLVVQQRRLLDDREKLVSQIQALPGFDTFLMSLSFDTLRSAACRGPVIIINHSKWRCDILILLHNTLPSLIPTSDDFYERANNL